MATPALDRLIRRATRDIDDVANARARIADDRMARIEGRTERRKERAEAVVELAMNGPYWKEAVRRQLILDEIGEDGGKQAEEMAAMSGDVCAWIDRWAWAFNPKPNGPKTIPLELFEVQREMLADLDRLMEEATGAQADGWGTGRFSVEERKAMLQQIEAAMNGQAHDLPDEEEEGYVQANSVTAMIEKSRDMGGTWIVVAWMVHRWLYDPGFAGIVASQKLGKADKRGSLQSVLEKARFIVRHLPTWMRPLGYEERIHATQGHLRNPQNGSEIVAEGGREIGRGGRAAFTLVDEAAFIPFPEEAESALSQTSALTVYLSTPNSPQDWFHVRRQSGMWHVITLHWLRDPRKNRWVAEDALGVVVARGNGPLPMKEPDWARVYHPWYEAERARYVDPYMMAREIDINYEGSAEDSLFPSVWIDACIDMELPVSGTRQAGADPSGDGPNETVWGHRIGPVVVALVPIKAANATLAARDILRRTAKSGAKALLYDASGGWGGSIKGEYESGDVRYTFEMEAVNGGTPASKNRFAGTKAEELFKDRRSEDGWALRERMRRTFERRLWERGDPAGIEHSPEDCISIPRDMKLRAQLAGIKYGYTTSGKIAMESKDEMRDRQFASPDRADALMLMFSRRRKFPIAPVGMGASVAVPS